MKANRKIGRGEEEPASKRERGYHGRIFGALDQDKCLSSVQLHQLEKSFRDWTGAASRIDVQTSRLRVLIIFLLIRYTGAKLNEVLGLDPFQDIDFKNQFVRFGSAKEKSVRSHRKVYLSEILCREIQAIISDYSSKKNSRNSLDMDPGFVRRKFYERAEECGFAKQLGAPENIRKSRAVELMQNNMPLPAVQTLLGHSTPNLTTSYVSFSEDEIQHVTRLFMEKESARKTSARNSFFGKVQNIRKGDIQTGVELATIGGYSVNTVITNDSVERLGLKVGNMIAAEVKAPWVLLQKGGDRNVSSADNMLQGIVEKITRGEINTEYVVRISDGTRICSLVTSESSRRLGLSEEDEVWILFSGYSVVLMSE